jgi:hypothetical protein
MDKELLNCLTQKHIDGMKKWINIRDSKKGTSCPFADIPHKLREYPQCGICRIMFKLPFYFCPCRSFSVSHVTKVAKQTVQEWEVSEKGGHDGRLNKI